jgi:hypothetical protein
VTTTLHLLRTAHDFVTRAGDAGYPIVSVTAGSNAITADLDYRIDHPRFGSDLAATLGLDVLVTRDRSECTFTHVVFRGVPVTIFGSRRPAETSPAPTRATYSCMSCGFHIVDDSDDHAGFDEAVSDHETEHEYTATESAVSL